MATSICKFVFIYIAIIHIGIESRFGFDHVFEKFKTATDDDLRNASKFIVKSNISKLATKYLGLISQEIHGRDVFNVLKLWRDAMPYHGSKQVRVAKLLKITNVIISLLFLLCHTNGASNDMEMMYD